MISAHHRPRAPRRHCYGNRDSSKARALCLRPYHAIEEWLRVPDPIKMPIALLRQPHPNSRQTRGAHALLAECAWVNFNAHVAPSNHSGRVFSVSVLPAPSRAVQQDQHPEKLGGASSSYLSFDQSRSRKSPSAAVYLRCSSRPSTRADFNIGPLRARCALSQARREKTRANGPTREADPCICRG